jgi:N-acetylglutamate synthase-like GNAT family acetyltransferase
VIQRYGGARDVVETGLTNQTVFSIRRAVAQDKDAVLAFCARTFEWGDYLPEVWEQWLADEKGQFLVATQDGVPVGVAKVTLLTPSEAWLEGLRVDPQHRHAGLGWQFQTACLEVARRSGVDVARLATGSKNLAIHKMAERSGMHRMAAAWPLEASALASEKESASLTHLGMSDWGPISTRILQGSTLAALHGLYGAGWTWEAMTEDKLRAHLRRGQVLALCDGEAEIAAVAITLDPDPIGRSLPIAYVDGGASRAQDLALALRHYAATLHLEKVGAMLPAASLLRQAFLQAGYQPELEVDGAIWIYETTWKGAAA